MPNQPSRFRRALVTGADGFIGSHLVEALVRGGWDVRAFVLYNSFNSWGWLDHVERETKDALQIFAGDIRDPRNVRTAMRDRDIVFHLAALNSIPYSYDSPASFVDTNVNGTLNILEAARDLGTQRVIHTSTSEVYGTAQTVPIDEDHPLNAQSPYAASKVGADQMALAFHRAFEVPVAVLRPFNTYGPRQSARAVIPTVITQALNGGKVRLGTLRPTRDFNYVADTVAAFLAMSESDRAVGRVVNSATNHETSIGDLVTLIGEVMGMELDVTSDDSRFRPQASEVDRLKGDNTRARDLIGWSPRYAGRDGLRRGIEETLVWYRNKDNLAHFKSEIYNI